MTSPSRVQERRAEGRQDARALRWFWWAAWAARKTAWALLALWGVTLLTFLVVELALAGRPDSRSGAGLSQGMTASDFEELRKSYGWDLPVLFNLHVQDRGRRVVRDLRRFVAHPKDPAARERLLRRGTLIFPEVFEFLSKSRSPDHRKALCLLVAQILAARGWLDVPERPGDCLRWWRRHKKEFSASSIQRLVGQSLDASHGAKESLLRLGRRTVPVIYAGLLRSKGQANRLCASSDLLTRITGHSVWCDPGAGARARHAVVESWRDWWDAHEADYRDLSRRERLLGMITRTRYGRWVSRLLQGRLGMSSYYRRPVTSILAARLPVTFGIGLAALALAFLVGLPLGVWLGRRRQARSGKVVDAGLLVAYCSPTYVVGLGLVFLVGGLGGLALFPSGGLHSLPGASGVGGGFLDLVWHATLPVITLAFGLTAMVARYGAESVGRALSEPHILAARSRGLPEGRLVWNHAVRNGLLPLINVFGLMIPTLVTGAVVVETIFDLPGVGQALMVALWNRDPNLFMGILVVSALATLLGIGLAELGMWLADPRLRRKGRAGS